MSKIEIPTENYNRVRNASGAFSHHNGDIVAESLQGLELEEVYEVASKILTEAATRGKPDAEPVSIDFLQSKYGHLNAGQQRMNLGNRIRGAISAIDKANERIVAKAAKDEVSPPSLDSAEQYIRSIAAPYREAVAERMKELEAEKARKEEERKKAAEEKAAKKKAAEEKAAKEEQDAASA